MPEANVCSWTAFSVDTPAAAETQPSGLYQQACIEAFDLDSLDTVAADTTSAGVPTEDQDSSAAAAQVSDTAVAAPTPGSPSTTVPPSSPSQEDEVDNGYLSISEFSDTLLLSKLHSLPSISLD